MADMCKKKYIGGNKFVKKHSKDIGEMYGHTVKVKPFRNSSQRSFKISTMKSIIKSNKWQGFSMQSIKHQKSQAIVRKEKHWVTLEINYIAQLLDYHYVAAK